MKLCWVSIGSPEWQSARALRHRLFFAEHGLPPAVMDDGTEQDAWHLVAVDDGKVLGYGRLSTSAANRYQVSQMVVESNCQGLVIGRKILGTLIDRARQHDARIIHLSAKMTAIDFYAKKGFEVKGVPYPSAKTAVEHVLMEKFL